MFHENRASVVQQTQLSTQNTRHDFFDGVSPRTGFLFGTITGIAVIAVVALGLVLSGGLFLAAGGSSVSTSKIVASATGDQAAPTAATVKPTRNAACPGG